MPSLHTLSKNQAQQLMLASLALLKNLRRNAIKEDLLTVIRQIHNLQLDTISVVARAHLHILGSRLGSYNPAWLEELHAQGDLFEYFSHGVCLLPIEYYPLIRARMLNKFMGWNMIEEWGQQNADITQKVLEHVRQNGEVRVSDFKNKTPGGAWWDWKAEKLALENLYYHGELMISRRDKFQRVYDLRESVLPNWDDQAAPAYEEAVKALVLKAVNALGVANSTWAANYFYFKKGETGAALKALEQEGKILKVSIENLKGGPFFVPREDPSLLIAALNNKLNPTMTTILSPFDPLVSDRGRSRELFDFDYQIECYTPAPKRKYGYFVLPVLHKGKLVGRMDAKVWRKEKRLQVIKLFLEPGIKVSIPLVRDLSGSLKSYASWQGLDTVEIDLSDPEAFKEALQAELKA